MNNEQKQQAKQLIADWTNVSRTSTPAVWFLNGDCMAGFLQELIDAPEPEQPNQSEQHLEMARDAERLNWILPSVTGEDSQTANTRTFLLAHQLLTGKTGKTAIDAAIAAEKGEKWK